MRLRKGASPPKGLASCGTTPITHFPLCWGWGQPGVPVVVFLGRQRHAVQRVMSMEPLLLFQRQALQLGGLCVHGLQLMSG